MMRFSEALLHYELKAWFFVIFLVSFVLYYFLWIVYVCTLYPLAKILGPL
jgi:hypothetical protein